MKSPGSRQKWGFESFAELQANPNRLILTVQQAGTAAAQLRVLFELEHQGQVIATGTRDLILEGNKRRLNALQLIDFKALQIRYGYGETLPPGEYTVRLATNTVPPSVPSITQGKFSVERKTVSLATVVGAQKFKTWKELQETPDRVILKVQQTGHTPITISVLTEIEHKDVLIAKSSKIIQLQKAADEFKATDFIDFDTVTLHPQYSEFLPPGDYIVRTICNTMPVTLQSVATSRFAIEQEKIELSSTIEEHVDPYDDYRPRSPELVFKLGSDKKKPLRLVFEVPAELAKQLSFEGDLTPIQPAAIKTEVAPAKPVEPPKPRVEWVREWMFTDESRTDLEKFLKEGPEFVKCLQEHAEYILSICKPKPVELPAPVAVAAPEPIVPKEIAETLESLLVDYRTIALQKSLLLKYELSRDLMVEFDPKLLTLPLKRILDFAIRKASGTGTLWVKTLCEDGKSLIEISTDLGEQNAQVATRIQEWSESTQIFNSDILGLEREIDSAFGGRLHSKSEFLNEVRLVIELPAPQKTTVPISGSEPEKVAA